jgi:hypothetical protein
VHAEAENFFQQAMEVEPDECGCDYVNIIEKKSEQVEERQIWSCSLDWLHEEQLEGWVDLKTLGRHIGEVRGAEQKKARWLESGVSS